MRTLLATTVLATALSHVHTVAQSASPSIHKERTKVLVHVTQRPGESDACRARLPSSEEGDAVTLFLAGDAVQLMRDGVLDNLSGLGTGKLRDSFDAIVKGGSRFYLSGMSSNAHGISESDLKGSQPHRTAKPAPPHCTARALVSTLRPQLSFG